MASAPFSIGKILALLVGAGFALRLAIFVTAENVLEVSEAIVGLMALDILDGTALPFFFYGTSYNGGGALEAYLAAASIALLGPGAGALKLWILALWLTSACLFADLCRRTLARDQAILAVAFFSLSTPFFLEWSLKARGGFIETVLFSTLLLWLAAPPAALRDRRDLQWTGFGITIGVGIWASEMLLAMIACAAVWLWVGLDQRERLRALRVVGMAAIAALVPLLIYNLNHDWQHLRSSVLYALVSPEGGATLTLSQLQIAAAFVLGQAWPILLVLFAIGAARVFAARSGWQLGHVALAHTLLYSAAFWLAGERYLSTPPSRVLFSLYPSIAVLFGYALAPSHRGRRGSRSVRGLVALALAIWALAVGSSIYQWTASGQPREAGSWRGSWALTDGRGLLAELASLDIDQVYTAWWTVPPLEFARRSAANSHANSRPEISWEIPPTPPSTQASAAIVLHREGPLTAHVARVLARRAITHRRLEWEGFVIFHGMPASQLHQGIGLPAVLAQADWPPEPERLDGFN